MLRCARARNAVSNLPETEGRNPRSLGFDLLTTPDLVALLIEEQREAIEAVLTVRALIASVVDGIVARILAGGRLHYVGAGTSGRLGMLDAAEMPPTFGTPPELVCAHIAGGMTALVRAIEGAEDDGDAGASEMRGHVAPGDAVIGLSASGGATYVVRAVEAARAIGALTVGVANTADARLLRAAEFPIALATGSEPLAGSTRLKAGTSQKVLLNTISTAVMVRLGKTYDNLMIDVVATNAKLRDRARRLFLQVVGGDEASADALLEATEGRVKPAVLMGRLGISAQEAYDLLARHDGSLRASLGD